MTEAERKMGTSGPALLATNLLLGGALLMLAGCGGPSSDGAAALSAPISATASAINAMPRDRLRDGGTFTWPIDEIPPNFNYYQIDGTLQDTGWVMIGSLMPSTYDTDAAAVPLWDRDLLASEPTLVTEPAQVVTYEINPKAAWYDGTPITWEDFYWQWKASSGADPAYRISAANGYENIGNVERGKDDREAIVTFAKPFADWQSLFSPIYPASTNKDPAIFNDGWKERPLTTAGPFKLDSINATTKTITLVRNEKWWGDAAKLDRVVFRAIVPDAQIDALANGEIDAMDVGPDANKYHRAAAIEGVDIRVAGGPNFRHLTINGTSPNLTDVRVRRALAMAIDRDAIARALLGPLGITPQPLNNHIFMANQEGYRDNSGEIGAYDPMKAAALLDEAGWKLEGGVRKKDGKPLEISGVIPGAIQTSRQEMELIQNMLGQIGVTLRIDTVPSDDFFEKYITPGQFDFTVFSWMGTPFPVTSAKSIYVNPVPGEEGRLRIQQNYARVGSPEIDALFDRAAAEFDRAKAEDLANQADALIWQEVHSLTLYQRPELIATKKGLANFGAFGFQTPWRFQDIGWVAAQ
jgi:peptide/nickel transport system substrate-binding protein